MKTSHRIFLYNIIIISFLSGCIPKTSSHQYSELWGKSGEKWSPESRLPDFSFAGYHFGEDPIPTIPIVTNVRDFGAKGDGKTDNTQAFNDAIAATENGAILIPEGRYSITNFIKINKSNIVLRGEGQGKTILYFPKELEDVKSDLSKTDKRKKKRSNYSWAHGYITMEGSFEKKKLATVLSESKRGEKTLTLDTVKNLKKGQSISVRLHDDKERSLTSYLYSGDTGDISGFNTMSTRLISRIASIKENEITLERPLRFDIRKSWTPIINSFASTISEVGIENMTLEFPSKKPYMGHFTERGYNGISMFEVFDCWVRNIEIVNADSGIFAKGMFCTLENILLRSDRQPFHGTTGHHGLSLGQDILLQNFEFKTHFIHDIDVINFTSGNVAKNGRATNLSADHHAKGPYENLFCNIDIGIGDQFWRCGGTWNHGKKCGVRSTFWRIKSKKNLSWPPKKFGPDTINLIGLTTKDKEQKDPNGKWFEPIPPEKLFPVDLHAAQLKRRLKKKKHSFFDS